MVRKNDGNQTMTTEDIQDTDCRKSFVMVKGDWIDASKVEFLDISEDLYGRDCMTFIYDGNQYESVVVTK